MIVVLTALFVGATWYATSRQARIYEGSTLVRLQEGNAGNASAALLAAQTLTQTYAKIIGSGALRGEIRTLVVECSRRNSASTQTPLAAPTRQRGAASPGIVHSPPAGSCESLGSTKGVSPREVSEVELSGNPVQDLDLLSITARNKNPTKAVIAANAVPWALRAFIRKTGSHNEKIVTVKAATMPSSPVSRQLPLKIAIAVMIGLIFNGALALFLELFRDRLPEPDELGRWLGHPVLATIPILRLHPIPAVVARGEPGSVLAVERSSDDDGEARATPGRVGPGS
jgi:capsular polysaccharide biosynthesis protein